MDCVSFVMSTAPRPQMQNLPLTSALFAVFRRLLDSDKSTSTVSRPRFPRRLLVAKFSAFYRSSIGKKIIVALTETHRIMQAIDVV